MKNLKNRVILYAVFAVIITILPVVILPFINIGDSPTTEHYHIYFLIHFGIYFAFQNIIYFIESKNMDNLYKTLLVNALIALPLGLMSGLGSNLYMGSTSAVKAINLTWAFAIAAAIAAAYLWVIKIILLMTTDGDKNKEIIVRKIFFLLINNIKWNEKDNIVLLNKKDKEIAILYINQNDKVNLIQWKHETESKQTKEVKDLFEEIESSKTTIPDDSLANEIRSYTNMYNDVVVFFENEKTLSEIGVSPNNVKISELKNFSGVINEILKGNNE